MNDIIVSTAPKQVQPPLALHEAAIDKYRSTNAEGAPVPDSELDALGSAMAMARRDVEKLAAFAEAVAADRTHTAEANALRVRQQALKAGERAGERLDQARARALQVIEQIRKTTWSPPAPQDDGAVRLETEVRQRLAALPHEDRSRTIGKAISDDDDLMLGAFLRGPCLLVGVSEVEQNYRRQQWRRRRHPEQVDREVRLEKAVAALDRGGEAMLAVIKTVTASPEAEQAERSVKAVAEAQAAAGK